MPDLYIAPGSNTGFGLNANALYSLDQFSTNLFLEPYIGLGFGYNNVGDFDKFGTNLILGTSFNVLGGNIYADILQEISSICTKFLLDINSDFNSKH
jgi:hypothetical protein